MVDRSESGFDPNTEPSASESENAETNSATEISVAQSTQLQTVASEQTLGTISATASVPAEMAVEQVNGYDASKVIAIYEATDGGAVELPDGAEIEAILVSGSDLIIRTANGDLIIIKDALLNMPSILVGNIEIPADSLIAALEAEGIVVPASGDEEGPPSSGNNFTVDNPILNIFDPTELLPPTAFDRAFPTVEEFNNQFNLLTPGPDIAPPEIIDFIPLPPPPGVPPTPPINPETPVVVTEPALAAGGSSENADGDPANNSDPNEEAGIGVVIEAGSGDVIDLEFGDDLSAITVSGVAPGVVVEWSKDPDGNLIGSFDGVPTLLLEIDLPSNIPAESVGQGVISVALLETIQNADGNDRILVENIPVEVFDTNSLFDTSETSLEVLDDVPTAIDDDEQTVEEGQTIDGNVILPSVADDPDGSGTDISGADGPATLTHVDLRDGNGFVEIESGTEVIAGVYEFVVSGIGVYQFSSDGSWSFQAEDDNVVGQNRSATFDYRITDTDNDISEATQPILIPESDQICWVISQADTTVAEGSAQEYAISFTTNDLSAGETVSVKLEFTRDETEAGDFDPALTTLQGDFWDSVEDDIGTSGTTADGNGTYTFDATTGVLTVTAVNDIAADATLVTFDLTATDDSIAESDEDYQVSLVDNDSTATDTVPDKIETGTVSTTITDNDQICWVISQADTTVAEGSAQEYEISFTTNDLSAGETVSVKLEFTRDETEAGDFDPALTTLQEDFWDSVEDDIGTSGTTADGNGTYTFDATTGVLTVTAVNDIAADATLVTFDLTATDDSIAESDEDYQISLIDSDTATDTVPDKIETGTVSTTILNIDPLCWKLTAANSGSLDRNTVVEGDPASYTLELAGGVLAPGATATVQMTLNFIYVDPNPILNFDDADPEDVGTGGTNIDDALAATAAAINSAAGSVIAVVDTTNDVINITYDENTPTTITFDLPTYDDSLIENAEDFAVNISNPSSNSKIEPGFDEVVTTIIDNDTLLGVIVINEVGLNTSRLEGDPGDGNLFDSNTLDVPAGLSYIEIRNIEDNANNTTGSRLENVRLEITDGDKIILIDLSTSNVATIAAKGFLVLYENGTWTVYDADGAQSNNKNGTYSMTVLNSDRTLYDGSPTDWSDVITSDYTTADPLGISMYEDQGLILGNTTIDGILANDVDESVLTLGSVIWNGVAGASTPASAQGLLGPLVDNTQYNGQMSNQLTIAAVLGVASLLPMRYTNGDIDDSNLIYSRSFSDEVTGKGSVPGDRDNNGLFVDIDTNREQDWTTNQTSTQGAINAVSDGITDPVDPPDEPNDQDADDEMDPDQGGKSTEIDNSGIDAQFAGQSVVDSDGNSTTNPGEIVGGDGQDFLYGTNGGDTIRGGNHNDLLFGDGGNDIMYGDSGADLIVDVDGNDTFYGGSGDDILISGAEIEVYDPDSNMYVTKALLPGDLVAGSEANPNAPNNGSYNDILLGEAGDDIIFAGLGDDFLDGGDGADFLSGGAGENYIYTGGTADEDIVHFSAESLDGNDTVPTANDDPADLIVDFGAEDYLDLSDLFEADPGDLGDYAYTTTTVGGDTSVWVDSDGAGLTSNPLQIATIQSYVSPVSIIYTDDLGNETTDMI
ncbi:MAG: hypothetical protein ACR2OR_06265 [Hyphomicrobiales bacterium]